MNEQDIRNHLIASYEASNEEVNKYDILIAYESVGPWGCDSSSWFLLKDRETGEYYENHAGHCSCYGFEGQFRPEKTSLEYLKSDKFSFSAGGYDRDGNETTVKEFIAVL